MSDYQDELAKVARVARMQVAIFRRTEADGEKVLDLIRITFRKAMARDRTIDCRVGGMEGEGPPLELIDTAAMYQLIRNHFDIDVMDARRVKAWRKTAMSAARDELGLAE